MRSNIEFPFTEEYNYNDIRKVQKILIIMANEITKILDEHNIRYFITFGTLLGAVRHQGFIPWDDDFDLFLFDDQYDLALQYLRGELPNWMIVHDESNDPLYWPYWSRVRDLNSETYADLWTDDNLYKFRGINFDLYRLKKSNIAEAQLRILEENCSFYKRKHEKGILEESIYKEIMPNIMDKIDAQRKNLTNHKIIESEEVFYFVILTKIIKPEDIFPLRKYKFEDCYYWGPNNADALLKQAYGDYMQLPAYENRKPHYSKVKYIDSAFNYSAEDNLK